MRLLGRRDFVRGLGLAAGAPLLSPVARTLVREARAEAPPDKRFLFLGGNLSMGLATGNLARDEALFRPTIRSPDDFSLSASMRALEPLKAQVTIVSNMYAAATVANAGHGYIPSDFFSGRKGSWTTPSGPTFDRFLGAQLGANDRVSSLFFMGAPANEAPASSGIRCTDGPGQPYPPILDAASAYRAAFASAVPGVDGGELLARKKSVFDFVAGDVARMRARLSGSEVEKLDRYTESLRAVEKRLALALPRLDCSAAAPPAAAAPRTISNVESLVDVAVVALACGVSHVASVWLNHGDWTTLGLPPGSIHDNVYHANNAERLDVVIDWRMRQVARAWSRLVALGLDRRTLLVFSDPNGTQHHGGQSTQFLILVGDLGGKIRTGRVLDLPLKSYTVNDAWTSIARAFDVPIDRFGDPAACKGPLPGLV